MNKLILIVFLVGSFGVYQLLIALSPKPLEPLASSDWKKVEEQQISLVDDCQDFIGFHYGIVGSIPPPLRSYPQEPQTNAERLEAFRMQMENASFYREVKRNLESRKYADTVREIKCARKFKLLDEGASYLLVTDEYIKEIKKIGLKQYLKANGQRVPARQVKKVYESEQVGRQMIKSLSDGSFTDKTERRRTERVNELRKQMQNAMRGVSRDMSRRSYATGRAREYLYTLLYHCTTSNPEPARYIWERIESSQNQIAIKKIQRSADVGLLFKNELEDSFKRLDDCYAHRDAAQ